MPRASSRTRRRARGLDLLSRLNVFFTPMHRQLRSSSRHPARLVASGVLAFLLMLLGAAPVTAQTYLQETFETDGEGTRYDVIEVIDGTDTVIPSFNDGFTDYFTRTDGSDIDAEVELTGPEGTFFFAGQDLDGEGATLPLFLELGEESTAGTSGLVVRALFAEDDDGTNQDWDDGDYVRLQYSADGGAFEDLICFAGDGSDFNSEPGRDSDCDGVRDTGGPSLTQTFTEFTGVIPGTPSSVTLRIEVQLNAGDEDFAVDNIRLEESTTPTLSIAATDADKPEGDNGTTPFTFTVTRSGDTAGPASADFNVPTGGDVDGADFDGGVLPSGTVTFADGDTEQTITLDVAGDTDDEGDETFTVELGNATNATISTPTATGTIQNDDLTLSTISQARQDGVGASVLIEGVVTRTRGDFTYLQDTSGPTGATGLTIRQTSGDFFDDVAAGTIAEGTELRIEGTLGEFAGLLQVNGNDLASYTILGTQPVPAPQTVTLNELNTNGEDYEAELVRVSGADLSDTGSFAAATSYAITDGSGGGGGTTTDVVALRVPDADNTNADGEPIPTTTVTFIGALGQFNDFPGSGEPENVGYQLQLVNTSDLIPFAVPNAWINEFSYENDGTDTDELIEVIVEAGADITGLEVVLYNGSNGDPYDTIPLTDFTQSTTESQPDFDFYTYNTSDDTSLQNDSDGLALCFNGSVVTSGGTDVLLSYEGEFTANSDPALGGCAAGRLFPGIPDNAEQTSTTPVGQSVQLQGAGTDYGTLVTGSWVLDTSSFGVANANQPLPVELVAFDAVAQTDGAVSLTWSTASETNNAGFEIQRQQTSGSSLEPTWERIGFTEGAGTTDTPQSYRFRDTTPPFADSLVYRLRQIDTDGTEAFSDPVVIRQGLGANVQLATPFPNPVRQQATVRYIVPEGEAQPVRLQVYNLLGQRVATLVDEAKAPGREEVALDASRWASGTYFLRLQVGDVTKTRRVTVVR